MSRNGQVVEPAAVIVVNFPMPGGARFDWHTHPDHQLAWAPHGVLTVVIDTASFILPPTRALWIPVGTRHETGATGNATMRALYVKPKPDQVRWAEPTAVAVSPLVADLIGYLSDRSTEGTTRRHAEELLLDLLHPVPTAAVEVRPPQSDPARALAAALVADPTDRRTLADWGRHVGASERTLARAFIVETGLPFGRWRTLVRLQAALPELAAGRAVATVARQVGYDTTSAFVAAFRREIGLTPGSYFQPAPGRPLSSRPASSRPASSMRVSGRPDE